MLNRSPKKLAEKIVQYIEASIHTLIDQEKMNGLRKMWIVDTQKILVSATSGVTYKAFFDGGATPNPGDMKIGGYIQGPDNRSTIYEYSIDIGYGTNNEAEYNSLLHLCREIVHHEVLAVRIHGDSNLVVNQVNGVWRALDPRMIQLRDQVRNVLKKIHNWNLVHIPRGQNKKADFLT